MTATLSIDQASDLDWRSRSSCDDGTADLHFVDVEDLVEGGMSFNEAIYAADEATTLAKLICDGCPVISQCRDSAFENDEEWGVWGGFDQKERRALREKWLQGRTAVGLPLPLMVVKDQDALSEDPAANKKLARRNERARQVRDALLLKPHDWHTYSRGWGTHDRAEYLMVMDVILANPTQNGEVIAERLGKGRTWAMTMLRTAAQALSID